MSGSAPLPGGSAHPDESRLAPPGSPALQGGEWVVSYCVQSSGSGIPRLVNLSNPGSNESVDTVAP